ncbi:MAG: hypothetical protein ACWGPR_11835 [Candidatus Deferrimicrobiaceae bacterium]
MGDALTEILAEYDAYIDRAARRLWRAVGYASGVNAEDLAQAARERICKRLPGHSLDDVGLIKVVIRQGMQGELVRMIGDPDKAGRGALARRTKMLEDLREAGIEPAVTDDHSLLDYRTLLFRVWEALAEAPERDRRAFELRYRHFHTTKQATPQHVDRKRMLDVREGLRLRFWGEANSIGIVDGACYTPAPAGRNDAVELASEQGQA